MDPEVNVRLMKALADMDAARAKLDEACAALSGVIGAGGEHTKIAALSDRVRGTRHKLAHHKRRHTWRMDGGPKNGEGNS